MKLCIGSRASLLGCLCFCFRKSCRHYLSQRSCSMETKMRHSASGLMFRAKMAVCRAECRIRMLLYLNKCGYFNCFVENIASMQSLVADFYYETHIDVFRIELLHEIVCCFHCAASSEQVIVNQYGVFR